MAPINSHAVAHAVSMQVLSHDETSILVEAGGFTPMRWFLERGAHHMQATDDDNESEQPLKKRAKLVRSSKPRVRPVTPSTAVTIPLARVTVDIHFSETLAAKLPTPETIDRDVDFEESDGIPVILYYINDDGEDVQMQLAHPTHEGAILKADLSFLPPHVLDDLRMIASLDHQKFPTDRNPSKDRPASIIRYLLKRSMGGLYNVVRLEASIAWRDGASAFPAGVPVGKARVYPDYDLKARFFPDNSRNEAEHTQPWTPQDFYDSVRVPEKQQHCNLGNVLESQLYPFQERAVTWMLQREGVRLEHGHTAPVLPADLKDPDTIRFEEVYDSDGNTCYVNHLQAVISRHRPEPSAYRMSGGLLAEEMGLGKTVELMALVSLHRRTQPTEEKLFDIMSGTDVLPSKATLIVTPTSILPQWRSELRRHAPDLRVMHYEGIPPPTKKHDERKPLEDLTTNYDVILTTYQVLAREVHFAEDPPDRNMRRGRKFDRKRSPLVQVQFWRAVMDEAQMIETSVTAAARVACRIPRVHSWACLLYTSPSPRDGLLSRMPSSA